MEFELPQSSSHPASGPPSEPLHPRSGPTCCGPVVDSHRRCLKFTENHDGLPFCQQASLQPGLAGGVGMLAGAPQQEDQDQDQEDQDQSAVGSPSTQIGLHVVALHTVHTSQTHN